MRVQLRNMLLGLFLPLLLAGGCAVHEWPGEGVPVDVELDFVFDTEFSPFVDITYTKYSGSQKDYDVRYIVEAYRALKDGYDSRPFRRFVFSKDASVELDHSVRLSLEEGEYILRAWVDYVDAGSVEDRYYGTSDFSEVIVLDPYIGNNDFRDAFEGAVEVELVRSGVYEEPVNATVEMSRPLAKFQFIATDFQDLVTRALGKEDSTRGGTFDPDGYRIVFYYGSYLPYIYNVLTGKPIDSKLGVCFEGGMVPLNDEEALIGFDYVLVNGKESAVNVQVALYDDRDDLLSISDMVTVPIVRGKVTTVRGRFLTLDAGGGIAIDPGFDCEFNLIY